MKNSAHHSPIHARWGPSLFVTTVLSVVNKQFFELWNEEYRDGIKTR